MIAATVSPPAAPPHIDRAAAALAGIAYRLNSVDDLPTVLAAIGMAPLNAETRDVAQGRPVKAREGPSKASGPHSRPVPPVDRPDALEGPSRPFKLIVSTPASICPKLFENPKGKTSEQVQCGICLAGSRGAPETAA